MAITALMSRNKGVPRVQLTGAICSVSILFCSQSFAQGAEFEGGIRAGVRNTDNVFLVASPDEMDDTIYQVSPYLNLTYENQRVNASVSYQFDWYDYSDLGESNEFHRYDATFSGDLVQDTLYLDLGASRSQSAVNPDSLIPPGSLPGFGNVGDRDTYSYSPRFEKTFGRAVTVNANYRYEDVSYDESDFEDVGDIQDNVNESARFEIQNYKRQEGLTWAARYEWDETEYDRSLPWEYKKASAELGFWTNSNTRIFASGGQESAWDDPVDRSLQDGFWEAGFAYNNGDKLNAEFAAGERSFGSSWRGRLDFAFRRGELSVDYAETPTTTGRDQYARGNLVNPEEPNDFLARPGTSERYILKRGQASVNFEFRRTALGFTVFDEERTGRFRDDGTPLGDESQNGVSMTFSWRLGAKTELSASGSINSREFEDMGSSDWMTANLSASYQLGPSLGLSLAYDYSEQDPETGSTGRDYVSNIVSLYLSYSF
jgi:uncharacterized protein (PEP-CTERM system associated)